MIWGKSPKIFLGDFSWVLFLVSPVGTKHNFKVLSLFVGSVRGDAQQISMSAKIVAFTTPIVTMSVKRVLQIGLGKKTEPTIVIISSPRL